MSEPMMSQYTKDLMLLLCDDGVEREELTALVDSAFQDGQAFMAKQKDSGSETE